jgi:uncharacterized protein (DUF305 family)
MSAGDMKKLEVASGPAFDRLYLEMMIEHHKGAIEMAKKGKATEGKALATSVTTSPWPYSPSTLRTWQLFETQC